MPTPGHVTAAEWEELAIASVVCPECDSSWGTNCYEGDDVVPTHAERLQLTKKRAMPFCILRFKTPAARREFLRRWDDTSYGPFPGWEHDTKYTFYIEGQDAFDIAMELRNDLGRDVTLVEQGISVPS